MSRRAHGSLYRRKKAGKAFGVWFISYRAHGRRFTERAFTDRRASEQLLAQRLQESARDAVGLGDPYRRHRRAAIAVHVEAFLDGITSRHRTAKHRGLMKARLERALEGMDARRLDDLKLDVAEQFLAALLRGGASPRTRDHYALALRQFGAWLVDTARAGANPFRRLRGVARAADARRERMALTAHQVLLLVEAAEVRPVQRYAASRPRSSQVVLDRLAAAGRHRGALYLFSALTGLRSAECAGIRWADLDLTDGAAWVTPRASTTKAKRLEPLPLDYRLAERLRDLRTDLARAAGRVPPPSTTVFTVPRHLPELLRKDAVHAGIPVVDQDGRRLDFHALRATCATLMARAGVPQQVARKLMRHTTVAMTAKHYEKLSRDDLRVGSQQLADAFWNEASTALATATDAGSYGKRRNETRNEDDTPRKATS